MGMFDTLIDADNLDWQTKAFDCNLDEYQIGDAIPADGPASFQVEILGGAASHDSEHRYSLATIRDSVLVSIDDDRDRTLALLNYSGRLIAPADHTERTNP